MNKLMLAIAVILTSMVSQASDEVLVPVDHIYSPKGFDSNDNSEIILSGYLPSPCYKRPQASVRVVEKLIFVTMTALEGSGEDQSDRQAPLCPQVLVPYVESVNLGQLPHGRYTVVANANSQFQRRGELEVTLATRPNIDDNLYAQVEYIEKRMGSREVRLKGYMPSSCFQFDRIEFISNGRDTYSVLPILKQVAEFCPMKLVPFDIPMPVPQTLSAETVLLHVRVMSGKSYNTLFFNR